MTSNVSGHFVKPAQRPTYVEFLGDSQTIGLVTYAHESAQELSWMCSACQPSATSADLLAALPSVLAKNPQAIHLMTGDLEIVAPGTNRGAAVMANIEAMVTAIQAAKIPLVIGNIPGLKTYTPYYLNLGLNDVFTGVTPEPGITTPVPIVDYYDAVYAVDPEATTLTTEDYAVMLPLTQAAIASLDVSAPR